jgi:hypothetical protein
MSNSESPQSMLYLTNLNVQKQHNEEVSAWKEGQKGLLAKYGIKEASYDEIDTLPLNEQDEFRKEYQAYGRLYPKMKPRTNRKLASNTTPRRNLINRRNVPPSPTRRRWLWGGKKNKKNMTKKARMTKKASRKARHSR